MIPNLQEDLSGNRKWTENEVSEQANARASGGYAEAKAPSGLTNNRYIPAAQL
jgi:hypothetical protein